MSYHHLSRKERGSLSLLRNQRKSIYEIAAALNRSPSTISRELRRNATKETSYRAKEAQIKYIEKRNNSRRKKLYENKDVCDYVTEKLLLCWSPEQIAGRMKIEKQKNTVSFASIYRWINEGLLPRSIELKSKLRRFRKRKKPIKMPSRPDAKTIHQRAKSVLRRTRFGDWEVDTMSFGMFPNQRYLLNINERKSRYCALFLLRNIKRDELMRAFSLVFSQSRLPLKSMTSDRGMEFNCHNEFESEFITPFYYTDKGKPWQKPTVENTNGLLRQHLPKGTKVDELPADRIPEIMHLLNNRPRKSLGFKTPAEMLHFT